MTSPVVEVAGLQDAPALADLFFKAFKDDFFHTLFPRNELGRDYLIKAYEGFMLSDENNSQEARVWVARSEKGKLASGSILSHS